MASDPIAAIAQAGLSALGHGDAAEARRAFEAVAAAGRATPRLLLHLADACARLGDELGEDAALDQVLVAEPRNLGALGRKGDRAAARGDDRAAAAFYNLLISSAALLGQLSSEQGALVHRAELGVAETSARFAAHLHATLDARRAGARFEEALAILSGLAQPQLQAPTSFFYPGLPQAAFYNPAEFDWVPRLEAATGAIRDELQGVRGTQGFRPYVEGDPARPNRGHALLDDPQWSAFHLIKNGAPVSANATRCPQTMALLETLPLPRIAGRSPMALFSVLEGGTHIPPHHGMLNTRLIVHLPLIVPDGCRLRVGNHTRNVVAGKAMIFDDSILHEAWNDSTETRIVLLFEVWRPELDDAERQGLTRMFDAIGSYASA